MLAMVTDHLALFAGLEPVRHTVGRLAMPLFFIVAGHLTARLSWRHARLAALGLTLPLLAPWIDSPNVLLWLAVGAAFIALCRRAHVSLWVLLAVALAGAANRVPELATGYPLNPLLGLMAAGALMPRTAFAWGDRLPRWLAWPGRHALAVYVGHVLALTALFGVS